MLYVYLTVDTTIYTYTFICMAVCLYLFPLETISPRGLGNLLVLFITVSPAASTMRGIEEDSTCICQSA